MGNCSSSPGFVIFCDSFDFLRVKMSVYSFCGGSVVFGVFDWFFLDLFFVVVYKLYLLVEIYFFSSALVPGWCF